MREKGLRSLEMIRMNRGKKENMRIYPDNPEFKAFKERLRKTNTFSKSSKHDSE